MRNSIRLALITAIFGLCGSCFSGIIHWGLGVNHQLDAQAAEAKETRDLASDHWNTVEKRLDSLDTHMSRIEDWLLHNKQDKK